MSTATLTLKFHLGYIYYKLDSSIGFRFNNRGSNELPNELRCCLNLPWLGADEAGSDW